MDNNWDFLNVVTHLRVKADNQTLPVRPPSSPKAKSAQQIDQQTAFYRSFATSAFYSRYSPIT
jgi:hypothetical protein